jgi:hypothetical protein
MYSTAEQGFDTSCIISSETLGANVKNLTKFKQQRDCIQTAKYISRFAICNNSQTEVLLRVVAQNETFENDPGQENLLHTTSSDKGLLAKLHHTLYTFKPQLEVRIIF